MTTVVAVVLAVLGAVGSIVGIVALVDARRTRRVKLFAWERSASVPLASASQADDNYKLSVMFERPGKEPEVIEAAWITYLRFANFGKEAIRREDIAQANRLAVAVRMPIDPDADEVGRILDIKLTGMSREVTKTEVGSVINFKQVAEGSITFDFLDYHDGGIVRVLSTERPETVEVTGDVIGMPDGVVRIDRDDPGGNRGLLGFAAWCVAEVAGLVGAVVLFHAVTDSWTDAWLLFVVPVAFLVIVAAAIGLAVGWPSRRPRKKFPSQLAIPDSLGFRGLPMHPRFWDESGVLVRYSPSTESKRKALEPGSEPSSPSRES